VTIPRNKLGHLIAAIGSGLLFVFLFVGWFGLGNVSRSGWQSFTIVDIVLAALALAVLVYSALHLVGSAASLPGWARPQFVTTAGGLASVLTLLFMIEGSQASDLKIGAFVSLLGSLAMLAGGYLIERPEMAERLASAAAAATSDTPAPPAPPAPGVATPAGPPTAATPPLGAGSPTASDPAVPVAGTPAAGQPATGQGAAAGPAAGEAPPSDPSGPPAGWYPDPQGQARLRYWDGSAWTDQTSA
jgi:hypothetical protein